jgi:hypothetical protein
MLTEMSNVQKNVLDAGWLSSIGLGWVAQLDWAFIIGVTVGIATLVVRVWEYYESKRTNDLKERELDQKDRELLKCQMNSESRKKLIDPLD